MAIKSKVKAKAMLKTKATKNSKVAEKAKSVKKLISKPRVKAKASKKLVSKSNIKTKALKKLISKPSVQAKPIRKLMTKPKVLKEKPINTPVLKPAVIAAAPVAVKTKSSALAKAAVVKRIMNPLIPRRPIKRSQRASQFAYMKAPGIEHDFEVSDTVEVFCDHEKNRERIRGWVKGIVVQVDHKMAAVQFRSNVYLTDGWMVPDRILWYPVNSEHIRAVAGKKFIKKEFIPDY